MYTLPDDFDVAVFVGRALTQISFTSNTVVFSFDGDILVTVEGEIRHECRNEHERWMDIAAVPITNSRQMRLLGRPVTRAAVQGQATLMLHFENDESLALVADTDKYECYQLRIGAREIVV